MDDSPVSNSDLVIGDDGRAQPAWAAHDDLLRHYYDTEWGLPVRDDRGMYERLVLEGFQAGLSWRTVLAKRDSFRRAYCGFDPQLVARFDDPDFTRLLGDADIIRNEKKIRAAVTNARATLELQAGGGSLADLVWSYRPEQQYRPRTAADVPSRSRESAALAKDLKKRGFTFVGPTSMFALMEATGVINTHLLGSWRRDSCADGAARGG